MKSTISLLATLLALFSSLHFASALQSARFYLVIDSSNPDLNGHALGACHEGAAIEGLCKASKVANADQSYQTFKFNYTRSQPNNGILVWQLAGSGFKFWEGMELYNDPSTNVALPLFYPDTQFTYVGFDKANHMFIRTYLDDTVNPPKSKIQELYRWYMCETYYTGYTYETLAWVNGKYPPQNPSCEKVQVKRVYVS